MHHLGGHERFLIGTPRVPLYSGMKIYHTEDTSMEFKNIKRDKIRSYTLTKTVNAFLNGQCNGTILYGVSDKGIIVGYQFNGAKDLDSLKVSILSYLSQTLISDCSFLDHIQVTFEPIDSPAKSHKKFIINITITPSTHPVYINESTQVPRGDYGSVFIRADGLNIKSTSIENLLLKKVEEIAQRDARISELTGEIRTLHVYIKNLIKQVKA